jgi:hypothetical protein
MQIITEHTGNVLSYPFAGEFLGINPDTGFPRSDRDYSEVDFIRIVADLWINGVVARNFRPLHVTAAAARMAIRINHGSIFINGRHAHIDTDSEAVQMTLPEGDDLPRIDLISMRLDLSTEIRAITPVIIRGEPSENPVAPDLTRNDIHYDMILAKINVPANALTITDANITDTRADTDICGMTHLSLDIATLNAQYNSIIEEQLVKFAAWVTDRESQLDAWFAQEQEKFNEWRSGREEDFNYWFDNIRDVLSDDAAYNLNNKIDNAAYNLNSKINDTADNLQKGIDESTLLPMILSRFPTEKVEGIEIQAGRRSGWSVVTFPRPFKNIPVVIPVPAAALTAASTLYPIGISTTGFEAIAVPSISSLNMDFYWIAIAGNLLNN